MQHRDGAAPEPAPALPRLAACGLRAGSQLSRALAAASQLTTVCVWADGREGRGDLASAGGAAGRKGICAAVRGKLLLRLCALRCASPALVAWSLPFERDWQDESVALRRQLFEMDKQVKKLNKEVERLTSENSCLNQQAAESAVFQLPSAAADRSRSTRKKTTSSVDMVMADVGNASSDGCDESVLSSGDHHMMQDSKVTQPSLRRSARRAGAKTALSMQPLPKRKASTRAAASKSVERDGEEHKHEAPSNSSKKKRVADSSTMSASSADENLESDAHSSQCKRKESAMPKAVAVAPVQDRAIGVSRHMSGGSGVMDEHPDPVEEQVPAGPPATAREQLQLLDLLAEANLQVQAGWQPRMRAIQQLKTLLTEPGKLLIEEQIFVSKMLPAMVVQLADLRSQVVRETCSSITAMLPVLVRYSREVATMLLPQLWKLTYVTIKAMSEAANQCLLSIATVLPIDLCVASVTDAIADPHPMCRTQAAVILNALLLRRDVTYPRRVSLDEDDDVVEIGLGAGKQASQVEVMCAILSKLLVDVSADVRTHSKLAFETLAKGWPEQGKALLEAAPDNVQRMLKVEAVGGGKAARQKVDVRALRRAAMHKLKSERGEAAAVSAKLTEGGCVGVVEVKENLGNRL